MTLRLPVKRFLENSQDLRDLPIRIIDKLVKISNQREYSTDELIFSQGDKCDFFYCVLSGTVLIDVISPLGKQISLSYLDAGCCFGEIALIDGAPRTADARATEPTVLISIDHGSFHRLMRKEPEFAVCIAQLLCARVRWATNRLSDSAFMHPQARLAKYLLNLAAHQGRLAASDKEIRISQSDLAKFLGVSRKSVNQQLSRWKEQGLIRVSRARLVLRDPESLRRLAAGTDDDRGFTD